jgi:hypothetical protein
MAPDQGAADRSIEVVNTAAFAVLVAFVMCAATVLLAVDRRATLPLAGFAFCVCLALSAAFALCASNGERSVGTPALGILIVIGCLCATGFISSRLNLPALTALCTLGGVLGAVLAGLWWRRNTPTSAPLAASALLIGTVLSGLYWGSGYLHPSMREALAAGLGVHRDDLFHLSLVNSILTYGVPSTALDGIPVIHYHFGSHVLWAALSAIARRPPLAVVPVVAPVLLSCTLILSWTEMVRQIRAMRGDTTLPSHYFVQLVALGFAAFIGMVPNGWAAEIGASFVNPIISESNALSMAIAFSTVSIALVHARRFRAAAFMGSPASITLMLAICVGIWAAALTKISIGALLVCLVCWSWIRIREYRRPVSTAMLAIVVVGFIKIAGLAAGAPGGPRLLLSPAHVAANVYVAVSTFWIPVMFGWTILYSALAEGLPERWSRRWLAQTWTNRSLLDVEYLWVLTIAGAIPALALETGGNGIYFTDFQRWIAVALLGAYSVERLSQRLGTLFAADWLGPRGLLVASLAVAPMMAILANGALPLVRSARRSREIARAVAHPRLSPPQQKVLALLDSIGAMPRDVRRTHMLFVDPSRLQGILPSTQECWTPPFIAPVLGGVALLGGVPRPPCSPVGFGFETYPASIAPRAVPAESLTNACRAARAHSFDRVFIIAGPDGLTQLIDTIC